jgi:hypothetical protein
MFLFLMTCVVINKLSADDSITEQYKKIIEKHMDNGIIKSIHLEDGDENYIAEFKEAGDKNDVIFDFFDEMKGVFQNQTVYPFKGYDTFNYTSKNQIENIWGHIITIYRYAGWTGIRITSIVRLIRGGITIGDAQIFIAASEKFMYYSGMAEACNIYTISESFSPILNNLEYTGNN